MSNEDFLKALEIIEIQFGRFESPVRDYLWERWKGTKIDMWRRMCGWIVDHCGVRPKAAKFLEAQKAVSPSYFTASRTEKKDRCPSCGGCGFDFIYFQVENNHYPYSGVIPCTACNSSQYIPKSSVSVSRYLSEAQYHQLHKDGSESDSGSERGIPVAVEEADSPDISDIGPWGDE
tara:strand:- start:9565 stop:10092 length:528 start_codon:yes stop_codon:yes gene_type:complete